MSGKLRLPPAPPSEGVHRLVCWMLGARLPGLRQTRIEEMRRALGEIMLDRVIAGEVVPCTILGSKLTQLTGGRVQARQFQRTTGRLWSDRPGWDARRPEWR